MTVLTVAGIGQAFGLIAALGVAGSWQVTTSLRRLLLIQAGFSLVFGLSYLLLANPAAALGNTLFPLAMLCLFRQRQNRNYLMRASLLALAFGAILFPAVGAWLFLYRPATWRMVILFATSGGANMLYYFLAGTNEKLLRRWTFLCVALWVVNNLVTPSIGGVALNLLEISSMAVGVIRSRRKTMATAGI